MTYPNGYIPLDKLTPIGDGLYLEHRAAVAWISARAEVFAETGIMPVVSKDGAYRDFAGQLRQKALAIADGEPMRAARPGSSTHGEGLSVDFWNIWQYNLDQLEGIMKKFGFRRNIPYESWHFTHDGSTLAPAGSTGTPISTTPPISTTLPIEAEDEDIMAKTIQIHYKRADGQLVRALATPGTPYFAPWTEAGSSIANGLATALDTGNSVEVTKSMFDMLKKTAEALLPRNVLTIEIVDADKAP